MAKTWGNGRQRRWLRARIRLVSPVTIVASAVVIAGCSGSDGVPAAESGSFGTAAVSSVGTGGSDLVAPAVAASSASTVAGPGTASTPATSSATASASTPAANPSRPPADTTVLRRVDRLTGTRLSPKSVVASSQGTVIANNMMYRHNMAFFDAAGTETAMVDDKVRLADFGIQGHPGESRGAPVEAAFTPDGSKVYVSNYAMYGAGFGPEGKDSCGLTRAGKPTTDTSFLYRVDVATHRIDQVIPVGAVPKYVAVTPDGATVLVTNWCGADMSVVDAATGRTVAAVRLGLHPRGIAVAPDGRTAYVAVMGESRLVAVDLGRARRGDRDAVRRLASPGSGVRHVVVSPDGRWLFTTNNGSGTVTKIDASTGEVVARRRTGAQPRSMAISADGRALYVVNYAASTMTKLRADNLTPLDEVRTDHHPIGVTYEPTRGRVWVACYGGSIIVYEDGLPRENRG